MAAAQSSSWARGAEHFQAEVLESGLHRAVFPLARVADYPGFVLLQRGQHGAVAGLQAGNILEYLGQFVVRQVRVVLFPQGGRELAGQGIRAWLRPQGVLLPAIAQGFVRDQGHVRFDGPVRHQCRQTADVIGVTMRDDQQVEAEGGAEPKICSNCSGIDGRSVRRRQSPGWPPSIRMRRSPSVQTRQSPYFSSPTSNR